MTNSKPKACLLLPLGSGPFYEKIVSVCDATPVPWGASREEVFAALSEAEGTLITSKMRVDKDFFDAAPKLRVVSSVSVGYDHLDIEEATKRGIAICHTPDVLTESVVNLAIGIILVLSRGIVDNAAYTRSGGWSRGDPPPPQGFEIQGKTLGVVGFGRIGTALTRRAQVFGMKTLFNDVFEELPAGAPESTYRPLPDLLRESDIVSLHPDLNPTSYHLIGKAELEAMKPTAYLINTSRGEVVDQAALTPALQNATIAGAALDVLEKEPPDPNDPIIGLPNLLSLPHTGAATLETRLAMIGRAVDNLVAVLSGKRPPSCANECVLT